MVGKGNAFHGAGQSHVGHAPFYEAGDQRNEPQSVINERQRYTDGKVGSHQNLDSKDERSIANKLASQERKPNSDKQHQPTERKPHNDKQFQPTEYDAEAEISKKDPTLPAQLHGNAPSKGAKIDKELQEEDELRLREKGIKK